MSDEGAALSVPQVVELLRPSRAGQLTPAQYRLATLFTEVYQDVPEATESLNSFIRRPHCGSCKRELVTLLTQDKERFERLMSHIDFTKALGGKLDESDELPARDAPVREANRLSPAHRRINPTPMEGEVRIIPDTPEAYHNLIRDLNAVNARFSGLAVMRDGDQLRVYFY